MHPPNPDSFSIRSSAQVQRPSLRLVRGRDWLGIEINPPRYVEVAEQRIQTTRQPNTTQPTKRKEVL